jgi:hypothetical protein
MWQKTAEQEIKDKHDNEERMRKYKENTEKKAEQEAKHKAEAEVLEKHSGS